MHLPAVMSVDVDIEMGPGQRRTVEMGQAIENNHKIGPVHAHTIGLEQDSAVSYMQHSDHSSKPTDILSVSVSVPVRVPVPPQLLVLSGTKIVYFHRGRLMVPGSPSRFLSDRVPQP